MVAHKRSRRSKKFLKAAFEGQERPVIINGGLRQKILGAIYNFTTYKGGQFKNH